MTIKIKSKAQFGENYNRFGRVIPVQETEIDIENYFNCKKDKVNFIYTRLKNDKKVEVKETIEPVKEVKKVEVKEEIKEVIKEETKETIKPVRKTGVK